MRLYRVGPLPSEIERDVLYQAVRGLQSSWLTDYLTGLGVVRGRWFTSLRAVAESYRHDHPAYALRHVDVSDEDAWRWSVQAQANLWRYATDGNEEYFLPEDVANRAVLTEDGDVSLH